VNELPKPGRDPLPYNSPFEQLLRRVQDYPSPVIAMIEGGVWGGGCDLALTCDMLVGCETASFAMTPAKIGIPYNPSGMIHFINVIGLNKAKEMFFTASPITASEALNLGILNHLVATAELDGDSGANRTPIPDQTGHPFRSKSTGHSDLNRTPL